MLRWINPRMNLIFLLECSPAEAFPIHVTTIAYKRPLSTQQKSGGCNFSCSTYLMWKVFLPQTITSYPSILIKESYDISPPNIILKVESQDSSVSEFFCFFSLFPKFAAGQIWGLKKKQKNPSKPATKNPHTFSRAKKNNELNMHILIN